MNIKFLKKNLLCETLRTLRLKADFVALHVCVLCAVCVAVSVLMVSCATRGKLKLDKERVIAIQEDTRAPLQFRGAATQPAMTDIPKVPLKLRWRRKLDALASREPVAAGGMVFASARNGTIDVIDAIKGNKIGRLRNKRTGITGSPVLSNDKMIVAFGRGRESLVAYHIRNGDRLWERNYGVIDASPLLIESDAIIAGLNGTISRIHLDDGVTVWSMEAQSPVYSTPVIVEQWVIAANMDGLVVALDLTSGQELWRTDAGAHIYAPLATDGVSLYVGTAGNTFLSLDCATGRINWQSETGGRVYGAATIMGEVVIFGCNDRKIHAVQRETGRPVWTVQTQGVVNTRPLPLGDVVLVGSLDHSLYAVNAESGTVDWSFEMPGQIRSTPILYDGRIYVCSEVKWLYCFEPEASL